MRESYKFPYAHNTYDDEIGGFMGFDVSNGKHITSGSPVQDLDD